MNSPLKNRQRDEERITIEMPNIVQGLSVSSICDVCISLCAGLFPEFNCTRKVHQVLFISPLWSNCYFMTGSFKRLSFSPAESKPLHVFVQELGHVIFTLPGFLNFGDSIIKARLACFGYNKSWYDAPNHYKPCKDEVNLPSLSTIPRCWVIYLKN